MTFIDAILASAVIYSFGWPCGLGRHIAEIVDAYEQRRAELRAEREAA
ncbi:hypothetical protein V5F77_05425 [Xanthobacter sp. DSM 24535]